MVIAHHVAQSSATIAINTLSMNLTVLTTGLIFSSFLRRKRSRPKGSFAPRKVSSKSYFILSPKQHDVNSLGIAGGN